MHIDTVHMFFCIAKAMYPGKPKQLTVWNGGSTFPVLPFVFMWITFVHTVFSLYSLNSILCIMFPKLIILAHDLMQILLI